MTMFYSFFNSRGRLSCRLLHFQPKWLFPTSYWYDVHAPVGHTSTLLPGLVTHACHSLLYCPVRVSIPTVACVATKSIYLFLPGRPTLSRRSRRTPPRSNAFFLCGHREQKSSNAETSVVLCRDENTKYWNALTVIQLFSGLIRLQRVEVCPELCEQCWNCYRNAPISFLQKLMIHKLCHPLWR